MTKPPPKGPRKYERVRRLGTDGPFVVEVAWPKQPGGVQQAVLLKRLRPGWPISSQALKQFIYDARDVSRVAHNNIVRVLDIAKDKHGPVLVTEHIHGVSLAAVLRQMREKDLSFTLAQVLSIVRQACSGLKAAQASGPEGRGIIHGAVSPQHLMITFEGVVKLKDFGIFRMYPVDQRGSLGGPNPVYLSVEQEQGLQPSIRSDLFALGRVLQKLLSLSADKQLPDEITGVLSRLLENDPTRRPPSAAVLEPELEALVLSHGEGHEGGRLQLGNFVRGLFKTETPASKAAAAEDARSPGRRWWFRPR
jgi:serine/threonine-protein kinase